MLPAAVHKAEDVQSAADEIIVTHRPPHRPPCIPFSTVPFWHSFIIFTKRNVHVAICMELNCATQVDTGIDNLLMTVHHVCRHGHTSLYHGKGAAHSLLGDTGVHLFGTRKY